MKWQDFQKVIHEGNLAVPSVERESDNNEKGDDDTLSNMGDKVKRQ